jgi:DHA1 family tetracycline resistance protein-like MFS transporter
MGMTMFATGALGIAVQSLAVGPVVARFGERGAVLFGALAGATGFVLYGFAPTGWAYLAAAPVFAFIGLLQPGLQGLMTRRVGPTEQGQLQGATQCLQGIAAIVGPAVYGTVFALAVRHDASWHMPGLPIYIAAGLLIVAFLLGLRVAPAPRAVPAPQAA